MAKKKFVLTLAALCIIAAVLYNSWPLGYWLDSSTARHGLASDLEIIGHPYYWLFIIGDVLAGLYAFTAGMLLRSKPWPALNSRAWSGVYCGLLIFGLFTAMDAFLPAQCSLTPLLRCGSSGGQGLSIDALTNAIAAAGLFLGLLSINLELRKTKAGLTNKLGWITLATSVAWVTISLSFILLAVAHSDTAHAFQELQLVLSGAGLIVIAANVQAALNSER